MEGDEKPEYAAEDKLKKADADMKGHWWLALVALHMKNILEVTRQKK